VHVVIDGKIAKTGKAELLEEIAVNGFKNF